MTFRFLALAFSVTAAWGIAPADTLILKNGIRLDGTVTKNAQGLYVMEANGRTVVYQPSEVIKFEKNANSAIESKQRAAERRAKAELKLKEQTGLNAAERTRVHAIMENLRSSNPRIREKAVQELVALSKTINVAKYFESSIDSMSPLVAPGVLDVLAHILPKDRLRKVLRAQATRLPIPNRAKAVELIGDAEMQDSQDILVRGLIDPAREVRFAAAKSLAKVGTRDTTAALIEVILADSMELREACKVALYSIWKDDLGSDPPNAQSEWIAFWKEKESVVYNPIQIASLRPLVDPNKTFVQE